MGSASNSPTPSSCSERFPGTEDHPLDLERIQPDTDTPRYIDFPASDNGVVTVSAGILEYWKESKLMTGFEHVSFAIRKNYDGKPIVDLELEKGKNGEERGWRLREDCPVKISQPEKVVDSAGLKSLHTKYAYEIMLNRRGKHP